MEKLPFRFLVFYRSILSLILWLNIRIVYCQFAVNGAVFPVFGIIWCASNDITTFLLCMELTCLTQPTLLQVSQTHLPVTAAMLVTVMPFGVPSYLLK
jgi:hypothetical protein